MRSRLAAFIGASCPEEIVFTCGATEGLNALAEIIGQRYFQPGDEVIVSELEHHANQIPWQMQQKKRGIRIKGWTLDENGCFAPFAAESTPSVYAITPR